MDRLQGNRHFLTTILKSKKRSYPRLILNAADENIKALIECFINFHSRADRKTVNKHKLFLSFFKPKKVSNIAKVKKYLSTQQDEVLKILKLTLNKPCKHGRKKEVG